ncbi:hypothetical protein [Erythrobacter sp. NAP1]|uniref:hypothetical protein n=1 Tax=Erythrobacter sp. NAP1 TaxID=237727 RepID=UPI000312F165|nr:hypothetical protein [Erythrobacter sp. NAP1]
MLGALIMTSNVLVNGYTAFGLGYQQFYFGLAFQAPFAAFVFFVAWRHWQATHSQIEGS